MRTLCAVCDVNCRRVTCRCWHYHPCFVWERRRHGRFTWSWKKTLTARTTIIIGRTRIPTLIDGVGPRLGAAATSFLAYFYFCGHFGANTIFIFGQIYILQKRVYFAKFSCNAWAATKVNISRRLCSRRFKGIAPLLARHDRSVLL